MARGALAGAIGGVAAGLVDHLFSAAGARQFLPDGTSRLLVFLVGLYGAAGAAVGGVAGCVIPMLGEGTDLGPLWRGAFCDEDSASEGARWGAYAIAGALALAAHGAMVYGVALTALLRFHGQFLIAVLVGVLASLLSLVALLISFLLAPLLSMVVRFGPRLRFARNSSRTSPPGAPLGVLLPLWLAGLGAGALAAARLVSAMQQRPRMTPVLRATNIALWAPPLVFGSLVIAHLLARTLGRRIGNSRELLRGRDGFAGGYFRFAQRPLGALAVVVLLVGGAAAIALRAEWEIAKLLPLRPFALGLLAAAGAIATWVFLTARSVSSPSTRGTSPALAARRVAIFVGVPAALFVVGIQAGRADRVRKAAANNAAFAGPLLDGIRALWDLDRDHFSPALALGPDCDDFDAEVHPGAFDWPDDGVDQNCNGHEATLRRAARPAFAPVAAAVPRQPNILLISIDALRFDHVGAYGYSRSTTPRIDALAREAALFKNGWAPSPSTRYSVPAMLVGRYESAIAWGSPSVHWPPQVLPENRLVSEMLKEHGYHTGALVPAHYFEPTWGLTQGFDDYDNSLAHLHSNPFGGDPARAAGSSSKELGDLGVSWIEKHGHGPEPFFLWMHFYDPHYLYEKHPDSPSFGEKDVDLYDGEIRFTDTHIGRVLDAVRAAGRWEDTVIIITADHGEGFGEHGVKQHGYHIYSQQNKVPFIVRVPGLPPRAIDEPINHVDLFPSLLNLLGAPDEPQLLGRSFVDLLQGQGEPRLVFQEVDFEGPTSRKAVASRDHQLIGNIVPDGTFEYYDLAADPAEEHDLFVRGAGGEQARLEGALGAWQDEIALPPDFVARVGGNLSPSPLPSAKAIGAHIRTEEAELVIDGVDIEPASPRAGQELVVSTVMHATKTIARGWRLFFHVRGPSGFLNLDHEPVESFVPLAKLRPGQWVRDRVRIAVPASWKGSFTVEIGLFRGGKRAEVSGPGQGKDSVRLADVTLAP